MDLLCLAVRTAVTHDQWKWGFELKPDGKPAYAWAAYTLPNDVDQVAVQDMHLGLVSDVPVSSAGADLPHVKGEPGVEELAWKGEPSSALSFRSSSSARRAHNKGDEVTVEVSSDVLFAFDEATLSTEAGKQLDQVAHRIESETDGPVTITGYTDSKRSNSYNNRLSTKRAQAVRDALDKRLDQPTTFTVAGKGEADPVAPNRKNGHDNPAGRERNRRVEITYNRGTEQSTATQTPSADTSPPSKPAELAGPVEGSEAETQGLEIQATGLQLVGRGVRLAFTITNTSSEPVSADQWGDPPDGYPGDLFDYHGGDAYWMNLEDVTNTKYWVVSASNQRCVCSTGYEYDIKPGAERTAWALLSPPPAGTQTIDVHFSGYGTVQDVPISE